MTDCFDIKAKAPFPAGALSNFALHAFTFDGVHCASMEGFLQSLKIEDVREQERVCYLAGPIAQSVDASTIGASRVAAHLVLAPRRSGCCLEKSKVPVSFGVGGNAW